MSALQARSVEDEQAAPERRSGDERYVSIFRNAKLSRADGSEELCVLRNISTGGAMLAHNSNFAVGERIKLDLRLDEQMAARIAWVKDQRCGVAFDTPADLPRILAGHSAGPRPRPPRLQVTAHVWLTTGQVTHPATLCNISQTGACLAIDEGRLPRAPEFRIALGELGDFRAIPCWRRGGLMGVNFVSTLPMWPLNDWVRKQR